MAVRIRIATKIFSLAVVLLGITVALSIFGAWQTRQVKHDLDRVAARDIPLGEILEEVDRDGLHRRLEFERQIEILDDVPLDQTALARSTQSYQRFQAEMTEDMQHAGAFLDRAMQSAADASDLVGIRSLLAEVERDDSLVTEIQRRIIEHRRAHQDAGVEEFLQLHDRLQQDLQQRRDDLNSRMERLTARTAQLAESRQATLTTVSIAASVSAVLLGLALAWLMSRRIVQPVQLLMSGVASVERGDLSTHLAVRSSDEIGALTVSFNKLVEELRAKAQLRETFGKYIDPRIVEGVILNPASAEAEGGKRVMTVSFCDLVGFTPIGEQLTPLALVRLLNRHFTLMAEAIRESQGVLDKFIGDAVMAFWGPPFNPSAEHAVLACRAALAQEKFLDRLRAELPDLTGIRKHLPVIDMRVGLASGEVVAGNIGAESARSYTVMGDTVNLASRLEGINRVYGTRILLNREARQLAGSAIETREIDWIAVKGKSEPATAYELLGLAGEVEPSRLLLRDRYEEALAAYRRFDWPAAEAALRGALEAAPDDPVTKVLLSRIDRFRGAPPEPAWDGVWRMAEK